MIDTLSTLDGNQIPGAIRTLKYRWSEDATWKTHAMRAKRGKKDADVRTERLATPQYQDPNDEVHAQLSLATDGCPTCIWLTDPRDIK